MVRISGSDTDMARGPLTLRSTNDICADCNSPDPKWASINRGILICDECCSIHRSLGRHVSQVKSLKKGLWAPSRLACVHQLMNSGANNIWEYALIDPALNKQHRRKPNPRDQIHPTKADFIRAKYQFLTFTNKQKDKDITTVKDLSKQLHSSVRTSNLETSLRLLSQGADPNFLHPERGNRAIHVACQSGQALQVELLVIYGADPGAIDYNGKTPHDYALEENHHDIAHRLVECQYELTDTLANYLCSRKPDHGTGQHFIIPELADSVDVSELAKAARKKLQALPNHLFEELAADVYDEVDRRENESIWVSTTANSPVNTRQSVPFLPVNPEFSSTRNQGRQKLARFNAREFATLIIDILSDAKRRQTGVPIPSTTNPQPLSNPVVLRTIKTTSYSDDEPAYDMVASDDDYSSLGDAVSLHDRPGVIETVEVDHEQGDNHRETLRSPTAANGVPPSPPRDDVELRMALQQSHVKVNELVSINRNLQQEMNLLQTTVKRLVNENEGLKSALHKNSQLAKSSPESSRHLDSNGRLPAESAIPQQHSNSLNNQHPMMAQFQSGVPLRMQGGKNRPHSMIERPKMNHLPINLESNLTTIYSGSLSQLSSRSEKGGRSDGMPEPDNDNGSLYDNDSVLQASSHRKAFPSYKSISEHTELITKQIQSLLLCAKNQQTKEFVACSDKITEFVDAMIDLFPLELDSDEIKSALSKLKSGAMQLCQEAKTPPPDVNGQPDIKTKTQLLIRYSYEIAKAAKVLVTQVATTEEAPN